MRREKIANQDKWEFDEEVQYNTIKKRRKRRDKTRFRMCMCVCERDENDTKETSLR